MPTCHETRPSAASFISGQLSHLESLLPESAVRKALRTKVQGSTICIQPIYLDNPDNTGVSFPGGRQFGLKVLTTCENLDHFANHAAHDDVYWMHLLSKEEQAKWTRTLSAKQGEASIPTGSEMQDIWSDIVKGEAAKGWDRYRDVKVISAQEADVLLTFADPKWRQMEEPGNTSGAF